MGKKVSYQSEMSFKLTGFDAVHFELMIQRYHREGKQRNLVYVGGLSQRFSHPTISQLVAFISRCDFSTARQIHRRCITPKNVEIEKLRVLEGT